MIEGWVGCAFYGVVATIRIMPTDHSFYTGLAFVLLQSSDPSETTVQVILIHIHSPHPPRIFGYVSTQPKIIGGGGLSRDHIPWHFLINICFLPYYY